MTDYAHAGGSSLPAGGLLARLIERMGHHANELLMASIAGAILLGLHPLPGLLEFTVPVALFAFVIASWLMMRKHDRRLCEPCMAAMPLNPSEDAVKYKRRFWMAHAGSEPRFLVPYVALLVGSNFFTGTIGRIAWAMIQMSMVYLILSQSSHRRLQPWCPICQGGGGGEKVDETPPVLPHDDRQLV
jgi:hypothetical protein